MSFSPSPTPGGSTKTNSSSEARPNHLTKDRAIRSVQLAGFYNVDFEHTSKSAIRIKQNIPTINSFFFHFHDTRNFQIARLQRWQTASKVTACAESPTLKMRLLGGSPAKAVASRLLPTPTGPRRTTTGAPADCESRVPLVYCLFLFWFKVPIKTVQRQSIERLTMPCGEGSGISQIEDLEPALRHSPNT